MMCVVYVLRRAGKRLPLDVVKSKPHLGWLFMGQDARKDIPEQAVRLFRSRGQRDDVMAPIVHPRLAKIDRGGLLFIGLEEVRSSVNQKQAWWIVPGPHHDPSSSA